MGWKDFFYFSKGERRALTLLLFMISLTLILLILKDYYILPQPINESPPESTQPIAADSTISIQENKPLVSAESKLAEKTKYKVKPRFNKSASTFAQKFPKGTVVELNTADTVVLKKVPGIGSVFANRIIKYRELLGGYTSVQQLREVYGIDDEKYGTLAVWFEADTSRVRKLTINHLSMEALAHHPYLNYKQAKVIITMRERKGALRDWQSIDLFDEFTSEDKLRLIPYVTFE